MKKKILVSLLAVAAVATLASCGGHEDKGSSVSSSGSTPVNPSSSNITPSGKVADGIRATYVMNGQNVVRVELAVKDSKVTKATISEAMYFTDDLATRVTDKDGNINPEQKGPEGDTFTATTKDYSGKASTSTYFKHLVIGGQKLTGSERTEKGDNKGGNTIFSNAEIPDFYTYVTSSQANLAWFFHTMESGDVYLGDVNGNKIADSKVGTLINRGGLMKRDVNNFKYWPDSWSKPTANKWLVNIEKIEKDLTGRNLDGDISDLKLTNKVSPSGATMESYDAYIKAAKIAFDGKPGTYFNVGYAMNGQNVDRVEMMKDNGKISNIYFDEAMYFTDDLATRVTDKDGNINPEQKGPEGDTFTATTKDYSGKASTSTYFKHLVIGGQKLTGSERAEKGDNKGGNTVFSNSDIADLYAYVTSSEANLEWFYDVMATGDVYLGDVNGNKIADSKVGTLINRGGLMKRDVNNFKYWPDSWSKPTANKWLVNIEKIEKDLTGRDLDGDISDLKLTNKVSPSGATMESYNAYIQLAKKVFDR